MLPHLASHDSERGQERPSLPSIRDLFGEELAQPVHKRPSPFSLTELGSSLSAESRSSSPTESQGSLRSSNLNSPQPVWSHLERRSSVEHAWKAPYHVPRRHSDIDIHSSTAALSTRSSRDQSITLPHVKQIPHPYYHHNRRSSSPYIMLSSRHAAESHGRSRSISEIPVTRDYRIRQEAFEAAAMRRHTIGSPLCPPSMRLPYPMESHPSSSRNPTPTGLKHASRAVPNLYPAPSTHPSLPRMMGISPPPSRPSSPPSVTSGDEAPTERRRSAAKYPCQYCGKCFNRPSSLKLHHNTHTGEKPFACPFPGCGRHFSVMSNMRRHARIHGDLSSQTAYEGSVEDNFDTSCTSYSSSSSAHNTPMIPQTKIMPSSHTSSTTSSPRHNLLPLSSASTSNDHRHQQSHVVRTHLHPYSRQTWSPSSEEGTSSP